MAEVSIDSLITPQKYELDERSISKNSGDQDSLSNRRSTDISRRRKSVGSNRAGGSSLQSSADKSEPHYLRASTGSCHDFCKFGRQHSFETKARRPFRKRVGKTFPSELSPIQIFVSGGKKEEVVEEIVSGKKKEDVISVHKKEEIVSNKNKKVISTGKKKEEIVSNKKEKVISGGKKKEEVVSSGKKKKGVVVSVGQKKGKAVSGAPTKERVVSIGQKKGKAVSAEQKKEEAVPIGETKEEVVDHGNPTDTRDHSAYEKPSPDTEPSPAKPKTSLDKEKATVNKCSTYTNNHSPYVPSSRNKPSLLKLSSHTKTYYPKQNDSSGNKTLFPKHKPSSAKKSPSADPPEIVKSVVFPYTEVADSVKQGSSPDDKISITAKRTASLAKQHSIPVNLKSVKVKPSPPSDDSVGMRRKGRRNCSAETGRKVMASKESIKKISTPPSTMTSKCSLNKKSPIKSGKPENLKIASSSLKDRSRLRRASSNKAPNDETVSEKTLHVISMETGNDISECISGDNVIPSSPRSPSSAKPSPHGKSSPLSSHEEDISETGKSDVEVDGSISENNASLKTTKEAAVKEISNKTTRKIRAVVPEDKYTYPVKLKFRMGKVVDLQSDNNTPRKLRFRRARLLGADDNKGDSRRRTSKRAGVDVDTAVIGDPSQKVVLKHQDVQGKKDAQGLLNNVIEETASKLAVSRKSKVKALVGAFETVISLQEVKPSTQAVS